MATKREVLEVLFPRVRAKVLEALFLAPQKQHYVRELMSVTGLSLHTVQDEVRKLSAIGLIVSWSNGYHRFYRANHHHPLSKDVANLVKRAVNLPATPHSFLQRQRSHLHRKRRVHARRQMRIGRRSPLDWNIFSKPKT
jgi:hypothetical protein